MARIRTGPASGAAVSARPFVARWHGTAFGPAGRSGDLSAHRTYLAALNAVRRQARALAPIWVRVEPYFRYSIVDSRSGETIARVDPAGRVTTVRPALTR